VPDLLSRIRDWLSTPAHEAEHDEIEWRLDAQRLRIRRLDAYVDARQAKERRHAFATGHPGRREKDGR